MENLKKIIFPDIEKLAEKDSPIATKRYAHLRLVNHFVWQSWAAFIVLVAFEQWDGLKFHLAILGALALGNGILALDFFKNRKNDQS